jgi:hypothetical protein
MKPKWLMKPWLAITLPVADTQLLPTHGLMRTMLTVEHDLVAIARRSYTKQVANERSLSKYHQHHLADLNIDHECPAF